MTTHFACLLNPVPRTFCGLGVFFQSPVRLCRAECSQVTKSLESCLANKGKVKTLRAANVTNLLSTSTTYSPSKGANRKQETGTLAAKKSITGTRAQLYPLVMLNQPAVQEATNNPPLIAKPRERSREEKNSGTF